jgi:MFS family permease
MSSRDTPGRPQFPLGRFVATYAPAYASLWLALLTPATITLALRVRQIAPGNATRPISLVLLTGALVALVSNPVFGALSDRTRSRFGRRRPYLVLGALCGFGALALIGLAQSLHMLLLGWCLAQLAYNAVLAAMVAIVADQVPPSRRGTVVGILGMCMPVGQIAGTFLVQQLAANLLWALLVPGAIGLAGVLLLAFSLREESVLPTVSRTGFGFDFDVARHRDFLWAWSSRVLFVVGSVFIQAYQPFLLLDELGFDAAEVPRLIFRSTLAQAAMTVTWSFVAGRLSDRLGRRKVLAMVGSVIQGMGLWIIAVAHSYSTLLLGVSLAGIGHGFYEGVDLALVTDVLPDRDLHAAKDLGLLNVANALPQVMAPLAAPVILDVSHGNYMLLFLVAGAVPVLGAALLLPVKSAR